MQRCPYIHEMKERLLGTPGEMLMMEPIDSNKEVLEVAPDPQVGTIVKLNSDGYGSHTSPTHTHVSHAHQCTPLMIREPGDDCQHICPVNTCVSTPCCGTGHHGPKNAKTSLFIIMSFIYAKLLVVICIAYVISDVITHNLPLYYYEGFFTYLYGMSILFLLYVFCFLLQESTCCSGSPPKPKPPPPEKKPKKEKEKKNKEKEKETKKEAKNKDKDKEKDAAKEKPTKESKKQSQFQDVVEVESGVPQRGLRRRKTSQNDHSHGSFFLRIGAIAFGLGTMIYNGLEFGAFFEVPFTSPCYQILRGVNPVLQMVFTFMQMYFIFMNSRLNIHRFKVVARFGLMHVVATNLCVWIRTLVLESLKEITAYHTKRGDHPEDGIILESIRLHTLRNAGTVLGTEVGGTRAIPTPTPFGVTSTTLKNIAYKAITFATTPSTTTDTPSSPQNGTEIESMDSLYPSALMGVNNSYGIPQSCGRVNIMGTIVQDSAPYLYPFIIEYSLIGAAVIYIMWKHIGRHSRYMTEEDLEHRLEVMLSRRAVAMAHAQQTGRVDCVGASKGLFFGLLLLVGSLICLILFFVLIRHPELGLLAIYLADVSHCVLMGLSILAIIIGFIRASVMSWTFRSPSHVHPCRVQQLKFRSEEQSDLNDILLRVSAFGLFVYAVFSVIAGSLGAFTNEPNLLVMITGILSVVQVVLQLLFIADVSRRRVHLPEQDRSKPARQVVTFLLICNVTMWLIYTFETQKVVANPVQLDFYGFLAWAIVQRVTLPLCIFHRFHSAVTLAEIWKTSYKARLE